MVSWRPVKCTLTRSKQNHLKFFNQLRVKHFLTLFKDSLGESNKGNDQKGEHLEWEQDSVPKTFGGESVRETTPFYEKKTKTLLFFESSMVSCFWTYLAHGILTQVHRQVLYVSLPPSPLPSSLLSPFLSFSPSLLHSFLPYEKWPDTMENSSERGKFSGGRLRWRSRPSPCPCPLALLGTRCGLWLDREGPLIQLGRLAILWWSCFPFV